MVVALKLAYRGTAYAGWQRQANAVTVQQRVEEALGELVGAPVPATGASRTDAGVHAAGQVAHVRAPLRLPLAALVHGTNRFLPPDIRVLAAARMPEEFHARKSARAKTYRYRLVRCEVLSPLDALFGVRAEEGLDLGAMRRATADLVGEHDFSAFALSGGSHRSPVRRVFAAEWAEAGPRLELVVTGSGFLRGMVRGLVGTLLEVGQGRRPPDAMARLLSGAPRAAAGPTAPASGLTLERVQYGETGPLW
jgi:tRNA pseudouridine38-40 synthase